MYKRYVFLMLGFLGSGKSHVSRWLTPHVGAVHIRTDALRTAMFGIDRPELYTPENKALVNNACRYAMLQIIKSGHAHVVQDANHNAKSLRREIAHDLAPNNGIAIVVYVQTPLETAKKRADIRAKTEGHVLFEPNLVEKMAKQLEKPGLDELVITIDGQASVDEQKRSFDSQLAILESQLTQDKGD